MANNLTAPVPAGTVFETVQNSDQSHRPVHLAPATDALLTTLNGKVPALVSGKTPVTLSDVVSVTPTAGELHLGEVGTSGSHPVATPTLGVLSYATGKCIGGLNDLANFARTAGKGVLIQSATLRAKSAQSTQIDLVIFRDTPAVTAGLGDNLTFAVDPSEISKVSKVIKFVTWDSVGVASLCTIDGIGKYMSLASGTTAKCILVARSAITLTSSSDLTLSLGLVQD